MISTLFAHQTFSSLLFSSLPLHAHDAPTSTTERVRAIDTAISSPRDSLTSSTTYPDPHDRPHSTGVSGDFLERHYHPATYSAYLISTTPSHRCKSVTPSSVPHSLVPSRLFLSFRPSLPCYTFLCHVLTRNQRCKQSNTSPASIKRMPSY